MASLSTHHDDAYYEVLETQPLQPCPFCGSDDIKSAISTRGLDIDQPYHLYSLSCCNCRVVNSKEDPHELWNWWNHREPSAFTESLAQTSISLPQKSAERLEAEIDAIPDMCSDFSLFEESIATAARLKKTGTSPPFAKLLFNLPLNHGRNIRAGSWLRILRVEDGAAFFELEGVEDNVTLDFLDLATPSAGTVIYNTGETIR